MRISCGQRRSAEPDSFIGPGEINESLWPLQLTFRTTTELSVAECRHPTGPAPHTRPPNNPTNPIYERNNKENATRPAGASTFTFLVPPPTLDAPE